jgi:hypothetical protein
MHDDSDVKATRALGEIMKKVIPPFCNAHSIALIVKSELSARGYEVVKKNRKSLVHADGLHRQRSTCDV